VVLRGLARDRKRRYRDLDEFRRALVPFLPARPSIGGVGLRLLAYLIDTFVLAVIGQLFGAALLFTRPLQLGALLVSDALGAALFLGYFSLLEGTRGWSLGKRLLRLRVGGPDGRPPGVPRALVRVAVVWGLFKFVPGVIGL